MELMEQDLNWYDQLYSKRLDWSTFAGEDAIHILEVGLCDLNEKVGLSILEVGCGAGGFLTEAKRTGIENVVGTDLSSAALQRAKGSLRQGEFVVADGLHLPFRERTFEIVACLGTLEHFNDPKTGAKQMYRVLEIGGSCLVVLPNPYFAYTILCKMLRRYRYQPIEHSLTTSKWKSCLRSIGFSVLKMAVSNPRSDHLLSAKSIPTLARLHPILKPLLRLYDKVRHSMPKIFSYHIIFVLRRACT
jgi:ubiquinone/menaquinone biosynthesis C-methylase UbiE